MAVRVEMEEGERKGTERRDEGARGIGMALRKMASFF